MSQGEVNKNELLEALQEEEGNQEEGNQERANQEEGNQEEGNQDKNQEHSFHLIKSSFVQRQLASSSWLEEFGKYFSYQNRELAMRILQLSPAAIG